ncbi:hypothetical protein [Comamonas aquatica]|uniref:Chemotaxis protein n=2 Tax=Comamonas aquatica TaxID=225991 RepID=A0A014MQF4_9BURK|nr:hypothetical protein [Comamonas aquatica]ANY60788.1 hypothetical protein MA05_00040 [Comamonas aquatica]EXU80394.1 hypothetical protein AX13_17660 [Comamonas aquatica DA1877]QTX20929.1 hypothetical protein KAQ61_18445 [Comamonas aquatica]WBM42432.1 hypothetical protein M2J84_01810 [Comamonas aquatica]CAB5692208.1 Uncharacterised protein [Comamonas aquatica]
MQPPQTPSAEPAVQVPVMVAAELQDSLLVVMRDLHRLEGLLNHATSNLLARFGEANVLLSDNAADDSPTVVAARAALRNAVTELQFHDMASQLIVHTTQVLQGCAFRLAAETMGREDEELEAPVVAMQPERPNPVTQSEMDAGSIELF